MYTLDAPSNSGAENNSLRELKLSWRRLKDLWVYLIYTRQFLWQMQYQKRLMISVNAAH